MQHHSNDGQDGGWKAWLWMAACCVPMIAVVILFALGYWTFR